MTYNDPIATRAVPSKSIRVITNECSGSPECRVELRVADVNPDTGRYKEIELHLTENEVSLIMRQMRQGIEDSYSALGLPFLRVSEPLTAAIRKNSSV